MGTIKISRQEMLSRVARFDALKASPQAFLDTRIPGHERDIFNVIGSGVTEDAALRPAIADARDFNVTYVGADPGKGAALHSHTTVEVFIPLTGKWTIYWGDDVEEEVVLNERDVISVPPGIMRGFRNAGHEHAYLMAITGGTDPGRVAWAPQVERAAAKTGLALDDKGDLVERVR